LQEVFPDAESGRIVLAFRATPHDIDEAHECFQNLKLLNALGTDFNQICNCTSVVDWFRGLFGASRRRDRRRRREWKTRGIGRRRVVPEANAILR
jgi:hypothetical protein